jgi:hypothetical protein
VHSTLASTWLWAALCEVFKTPYGSYTLFYSHNSKEGFRRKVGQKESITYIQTVAAVELKKHFYKATWECISRTIKLSIRFHLKTAVLTFT